MVYQFINNRIYIEIQKQMSENQMMVPRKQEQIKEEEVPSIPLLDIYQAQDSGQLLKQDRLKQFYTSLQFPCCGDYMQPKLTPIAQQKRIKEKKFVEGQEVQESKKLLQYDGLFEHNQIKKQTSTDITRLKTRLVKDLREEYFQANGQLIIQKQLFHEQLSRLANISFDQNYAIRTFQKNAILSQRNNQKKSTPFQLEINIGCVWLNKHQLQNGQQIKFEQLRPLMKELNTISSYPTIPELSKQLDYLLKVKQQLLQTEASQMQIEQIISKIQNAKKMLNKQIEHVHGVMDKVLRKWKQIKQIRRQTNMQTVPWRINVKQYNIDHDGHKSFDIGVTPLEIQKISAEGAQAELERRQKIKKQKYFVKIYINGYQVAKSQKIHLQWPSYRINFNQKFNITVYSAPSSVQVQFIKSGVINQTIDKVSLVLPGIHSRTITSSEERFAGASFALNGQKYRKGAEEPESPAGTVIYKIQWKGQGSRMPPVSFKAQQEQTAATQEGQVQQIDYELYDMKDPRVSQIKRQQIETEVIQGATALLPFVNIQSARHLLLKMKATHPQLEGLQIPLLQQQIRKRQDLLAILQKQKIRSLEQYDRSHEQFYNPAQGIFRTQDENILREIRQTLSRLQYIKINALKGGVKYKITEEIVNQYIFQQMQSPITVFCRNLFTQQRKLGPQVTHYQQARTNIQAIDINLHLRSARNMPIREQAFTRIRNFQQDQIRMNPARLQQMAGHTGNVDMYSNYGTGFYQKQPGMNIQGNNFFIPGMMNMGGGMRPNMEVSYEKKNLERNSTYAELRFKKLLKRTDCFEGPFPQWNQTLQFSYNMKAEGMTVQKLFNNNEKPLKILVFDMTEESKPTTAISQARIKKTKYYLGRIDVPMSMLVAVPSISGLYKIQRPLILFGYGIKKAGLFDFDQDIQQANRTQFPDVYTFLNLDLFTEPLIDNLTAYNADRKFISGGESTLLLQRCSDWLEDLNTKRYIRLWLNNLEGKSVFICKFLSNNITPPPLGPENQIERCARFVSLIPKKFTCKLMQNTEEFHLTCHQFLNIKMGEDHGILLCNYFNYIDKHSGRDYIQSYLAIGKAFPYGKSIFVVRRDTRNNDVEIWDPYHGQCVYIAAKQYDSFCCFKYAKKKQGENQKQFCSMVELGCLVSSNNVYINIQQHLKPEDLDYNLGEQKLWKPFLTQRMKTEYFDHSIIQSIQGEIMEDFYPKTKGIQSQLENRLYQYLRGQLQSQRKKHFRPYTFKINSNVSNAVRNKILLECEIFKNDYRLSGSESRMYSEHNAEQKAKYARALSKLQQAKNQIKGTVDADKFLYGFTLNVPFTTNKDIWQKIQQTQIHLDQTQNMQFVLSIRCFELACHVISVWVFVGTIA